MVYASKYSDISKFKIFKITVISIVGKLKSSVISIVNIHICMFHNDKVNINKAQFILNCHNPIYLDASVFRRDEIKFTDFGENTNILYSLSDFRTADGTRNGEDYMTNYLKGRYGAL